MLDKRFMVLILSLSLSTTAFAQGWLMSIPYALSSKHIYKVRVERIDGAIVTEELRYALSNGEHTITVRPLLDIEWSPDLVENSNLQGQSKDITVNVQEGKTYQLAVRVDIEASAESQLDQSFWSPFVYEVVEN